MADILILFPPDKAAAARQIAEALTAARYAGRLVPLGDGGGAAAIEAARGGGPAILVWSRTLAASASLDGWLGTLRKLPGVIEVSTDGIAPQEGDESRVVLLSGWRGQPFHLGWQRILGELEASGSAHRSVAAPQPAVERAAVASGAAGAAPGAAKVAAGGAGAGQSGAVAGRWRRFAVPAAVAAALIAAVGAATWIEKAPVDGERRESRSAAALEADEGQGAAAQADAAVPAGDGDLMAGVAEEDLVEAEPSAPVPVAAPSAPAAVAAAGVSAGAAASAADRTRTTAAAPRPAAKVRTAKAAAPKRYTKRGSKTMRRFCARSGRGTPECRVFARSQAAAKR
jgi:hypothetical protein